MANQIQSLAARFMSQGLSQEEAIRRAQAEVQAALQATQAPKAPQQAPAQPQAGTGMGTGILSQGQGVPFQGAAESIGQGAGDLGRGILSGAIAAPFKAAGGAIGGAVKDTLNSAGELGRDLGYRAGGLAPRRPLPEQGPVAVPQAVPEMDPGILSGAAGRQALRSEGTADRMTPPPVVPTAAPVDPVAAPVIPTSPPVAPVAAPVIPTAAPVAVPEAAPALMQAPQAQAQARPGDPQYMRGATSAKYESGGRYDAINPRDTGGSAYGRNQIHSKNMPEFTSKYAPGVFDGLRPGTEGFNARWKEWSVTADGKAAQHQYIDDTHFTPMSERLKSSIGLDVTARSPAVEELMYSTAVQMGPNSSVFEKALAGQDVGSMSDEAIINLVTDYKIQNKDSLFKSSPQGVRDDVGRRFEQERGDYMGMIGSTRGGVAGGGRPGAAATGEPGILSQGGPAGATPSVPNPAQSRADAWNEKIYGSPWKAALWHGLANLAEVDPYAHAQQLQDLDDAEFQRMYGTAGDAGKAQIEQVKLQQEQLKLQQMQQPQQAAAPGIKSQTWDPEMGGYHVLMDDGSTYFSKTPAEGFQPASTILAGKTAQERQAALFETRKAADNQFQAGQVQMDEAQRMVDDGFESGAFGMVGGSDVVAGKDKWMATLGSTEAEARVKVRAEAQQNVTTQTLSLLQGLKGATTDYEWEKLEASIPKASSTKAEWDAWLRYARKLQETAYRRSTGQDPQWQGSSAASQGVGGQPAQGANGARQPGYVSPSTASYYQ